MAGEVHVAEFSLPLHSMLPAELPLAEVGREAQESQED